MLDLDVIDVNIPAEDVEDWDTPPTSPNRPRRANREVAVRVDVSVWPKNQSMLEVTVPGNRQQLPADE